MRAQPHSRFRADVEGLRAVAIGAVLLAHAGIAQAAGGFVGVDVFFVISGFLITSGLVRAIESGGGIRLRDFYARRARRLLPLAFLVLAVTALVSAFVFTPVRNESVGRDVVASALYVVNWLFAIEAVDYFSASGAASPVQHFWSLAVEEQFYLVWPALLIAATWVLRRRGRDTTAALWLLVGGITAASFAYALYATDAAPSAAYFSTPARAWELGIGALAAMWLRHGRTVPAAAGGVLGLGGVVAIAVATLTFDSTTPMPGLPALVPTLGAVAVILGGTGRQLPLLTNRVARHVGRISYAWYLWHWPVVILAGGIWELSPAGEIAAIAFSYLPAYASHRLVEQPLLHAPALRRPSRALAMGAAATAAGAVAGVLVVSIAAAPTIPRLAADEALGAEAIPAEQPVAKASAVRPTPSDASKDRGRLYADGCLVTPRSTVVKRCAYGTGATKVVMIGDSHTLHWFPAMRRLASQRGWRLVTYVKAGCGASDVTLRNNELGRAYRECDAWRAKAIPRVQRERADLVFTTQYQETRVVRDGRTLSGADSKAAIAAGYPRTLKRLRAGGAKVLLMGDTPVAERNIPECVSGNLQSLRKCAFDLADVMRGPPANARRIADRLPGVAFVQPRGKLCPGGTCPAVMGGVLVYRDQHHLTATFNRTLATWLGRQLRYQDLP